MTSDYSLVPHPWDAWGAPPPLGETYDHDEDADVAEHNRLLNEARAKGDEADDLHEQARELEREADELYEQAEPIYGRLVRAHPDWAGALDDGRDPRAV